MDAVNRKAKSIFSISLDCIALFIHSFLEPNCCFIAGLFILVGWNAVQIPGLSFRKTSAHGVFVGSHIRFAWYGNFSSPLFPFPTLSFYFTLFVWHAYQICTILKYGDRWNHVPYFIGFIRSHKYKYFQTFNTFEFVSTCYYLIFDIKISIKLKKCDIVRLVY